MGGAFKATKEANQYEINEVHWNLIDATEQYEDEEEKLTVTRLVLNKHPYGQTMRILQGQRGTGELSAAARHRGTGHSAV